MYEPNVMAVLPDLTVRGQPFHPIFLKAYQDFTPIPPKEEMIKFKDSVLNFKKLALRLFCQSQL